MGSSRTENVARNAWFAFITQVANILISFISRTVYIYVLGVDYLGINGLFANILTILSFTEMGIGNAIIYSMYKPLAVGDEEKIKSLMSLYKKTYIAIGIFIAVAGLCLIPFLDFIIKDPPKIQENLTLIYLFFLADTAFSYFFAYKRSIIVADQKNYLVTLYQQGFHILQVIMQIIFLILTGKYLLFLLIKIICTITSNVLIARKADRMYPYLRSRKVEPLTSQERKSIFTNVRALFLYKFGSTILNGTDNIIISALIGVTAVGLSSNYLLIVSAINMILQQIKGAFTASVGNLNAVADTRSKEQVFNRIFFLSAWISGYTAAGLYMFLNPFIELWIGKEFLLDTGVVFAIVLSFYVSQMQFTAYTYRTTMGLFVQGRLAPISAATLNIILSVALAKPLGLMGIFLATSIARFSTIGIIDPILVYKKGFGKKPTYYFLKYCLFAFATGGLYLIVKPLIFWLEVGGFIGLMLKAVLMTILFNLGFYFLFNRAKEYQALKNIIKNVIRKKLKSLGMIH